MVRITRDKSVLSMSAKNDAVCRAASGDTVVFETLDCFSNKIKREDQLFGSVGWEDINPATGPLYVEGSSPGDTLKVEILKIVLDSQGVVAAAPGFGVFGDRIKEERTKIVPLEGGKALFNDKLTFPANPMVGVIGTAPPEGEDIPTGTPGAHGGNMDCRKIGEGSTLYLPVNTEGALLAMGDMHAIMGDGEVVVCGLEVSGEVTVRVEVIKEAALPLPFLVDQTHAMTIYSAETVDEAAKGAALRMSTFMTDNLAVDAYEAGMILSLVGNLSICQVVDPLMTCRMELPKEITDGYGYRFPGM